MSCNGILIIIIISRLRTERCWWYVIDTRLYVRHYYYKFKSAGRRLPASEIFAIPMTRSDGEFFGIQYIRWPFFFIKTGRRFRFLFFFNTSDIRPLLPATRV